MICNMEKAAADDFAALCDEAFARLRAARPGEVVTLPEGLVLQQLPGHRRINAKPEQARGEEGRRPDRDAQNVLIGRMAETIFNLAVTGEAVTEADLKRAGFDQGEIETLFPRAIKQAQAALAIIEQRGIHRARVPAGRAPFGQVPA